MKYTLFFGILSFVSAYYAIQGYYVLIWLFLNTSFFSIVYFINRPSLFLKSKTGKINPIIQIINLPWLAFAHFIWHLERLLSKEEPFNHLHNTEITIGRRLLKNETPDDIEVVVDLTSEFNETINESSAYINIPMLDAIAPNNTIHKSVKEVANIIKNKKTYVHCAQGHGRTATFTSLLLVELRVCKDLDDAQNLILKHRPKAKVSSSQKRFLGSSQNT